RRRTSSKKIFTRRHEDVHDLRVFGEKTFVLDVAGDHCNIPRGHRSPLTADAEIHPALEHPNDLFVRMLMCGSMCARLELPPHDHAMLPSKDAALDLVIDTLPRQSVERAKAGHYRHDFPPLRSNDGL